MAYVETFVAPVPEANREDYIAHARVMAEIFKEHGALEIMECWGTHVPDGEQTSFPLAVKLEQDETVVVGFVKWLSREHRDKAFQSAMSDPRMKNFNPPFDGKRLIFGGFDVIFEG